MSQEKNIRNRTKAYEHGHTRISDMTQNAVATITHNKGSKRYDFGKENLLPNKLLNAIEASVTASACRERRHEFVEGNGLKDRSIASMMVNPGQTADDLISEIADIAGVFKCVPLNVKFNMLGNAQHIYALPFENIRKADDGTFYVNEKIHEGKGDQKKDRIYYNEFDPKESPQSRLNRIAWQIREYGFQTGDIIYLFGKKSGQKHYPVPAAWAGLEEIEADAALGRLDWRNVKKSFRPDVIMTRIGAIDDTEVDENGRTAAWYHDQNMKKFIGENAAPILELEVSNKDEAPIITKFDSEKNLNQLTEAENRIGRRVCRAMEVPEVLIPGFAREGQLGNNQEVMNILKLYNNTIGKTQRLITRAMEMVHPQFDWTIEPLVLIEELPKWLIDTLTTEEKRVLGGYPDKPETTTA